MDRKKKAERERLVMATDTLIAELEDHDWQCIAIAWRRGRPEESFVRRGSLTDEESDRILTNIDSQLG